jgi:hypothetical protein
LTRDLYRRYGRDIQRALYFPLISPPASAWLTRALLYWDEVGTIVPDSWVDQPELLGTHTVDLIRRGLLRQVFPSQVGERHANRFESWLRGLGDDELAARQTRFAAGQIARIHEDKWLRYGSALEAAEQLDLARRWVDRSWLAVEERTAAEFMASLALDLCHPDSTLSRPSFGRPETWVPATGDERAFGALLAGLDGDGGAGDRAFSLRVGGELRVSDLRATVLERALPVPVEPPAPEQMETFRRRRGDRLPAVRRHIEDLIDSKLVLGDEVLVFRAVDRLAEEIEELVNEAEEYLKDAGLRRLHRSPLIRILKSVPLLSDPVTAAQETAQSLETSAHVEDHPLAYFAFARAELQLDPHYDGAPPHEALIEAFA